MSKENKIFKLPKFISKLKLRNQIFIIQIIAFTIIASTLACCLFVLLGIESSYILDIAEYVLIKNIVSKSSNTIVNFYQQRIYHGFLKSEFLLINVNSLYNVIYSNQIVFKNNVENSLLIDYSSYNSNIIYENTFSYGIFGNKINLDQITDKLELSNLLTEYLLYFPQNSLLYFTSVTDEQYFSINPGDYYNGYIPHSRPWYINQMQDQSLVFSNSDPYLDFWEGITVTKTKTLKNLSQNIIGVIGNDINMSNVWGEYNLQFWDIYLIDSDGRLILSNTYKKNSIQIDYIFNVSVLGFNYTDFQIITNQLPDSNYLCDFQLDGWNCLINKQNNLIYYVKTIKILDYFAVITFCKALIFEQLQELFKIREKMIYQNTQYILIILGICLLFFFILQYVCMKFIEIPIHRIMKCTKLIIETNQFPKEFFKLINDKKNDQIDNLKISFQNLLKNEGSNVKRRKIIKLLSDQQTYPINYAYYPVILKQIVNSKNKLENQHNKFTFLFLKDILKNYY